MNKKYLEIYVLLQSLGTGVIRPVSRMKSIRTRQFSRGKKQNNRYIRHDISVIPEKLTARHAVTIEKGEKIMKKKSF